MIINYSYQNTIKSASNKFLTSSSNIKRWRKLRRNLYLQNHKNTRRTLKYSIRNLQKVEKFKSLDKWIKDQRNKGIPLSIDTILQQALKIFPLRRSKTYGQNYGWMAYSLKKLGYVKRKINNFNDKIKEVEEKVINNFKKGYLM